MGACSSLENEVDDSSGSVTLEDFEVLGIIKKQTQGEVKLVRSKSVLYALKSVNKDLCKKTNMARYVIQERNIHSKLSSPFICNLKYSFQDADNFYFGLDYKAGMDLRQTLTKRKKLSESVVTVLVAEIASAVNYIHSQHVVHRNLRPENLLLDEIGHITLADFRMATQFNEKNLIYESAGTIGYMAPEVLKKCGYTHTVDWWSLGIIVYELLFGKRPFRGKTTDEIRASILSGKFNFTPDTQISKECETVIKGLLIAHSPNRLGDAEKGGFKKFKTLVWFKGIDWKGLLTTTPPFQPEIVSPQPPPPINQEKRRSSVLQAIGLKASSRDASAIDPLFINFNHSKLKSANRKPWASWINLVDTSVHQQRLPSETITFSAASTSGLSVSTQRERNPSFTVMDCDLSEAKSSDTSIVQKNSSGSLRHARID